MPTSTSLRRRLEEKLKDPKLGKIPTERRLEYKIAIQVRQLRSNAGLTQVGLAEKAHTSSRTISRLENGGLDHVTLGLLSRVAEALGRELVVKFVKPRSQR